MRKFIKRYLIIIVCALLWEVVTQWQIVPEYILPKLSNVIMSGINDMPILWMHMQVTLTETFLGLIVSIVLAVVGAFLMEKNQLVYDLFYPVIILMQTIPVIAIAPILIVWFGTGYLPKVILIVIVCVFPMIMQIYHALKKIDIAEINLLKTFGATNLQMIYFLKWKRILPDFFTSLKVSSSYAIVSAVVSEWLGGDSGIGVYIIRTRKSFAFDKMFASILLISFLTLCLVKSINFLEKKMIRYAYKGVKQK